MKWKQTEKVLIIVSAFDQPQTAPMKFLPKKTEFAFKMAIQYESVQNDAKSSEWMNNRI